MKSRRYHITKAQGEVILLALISLKSEMQQLSQRDPSPYWQYMLQRAEQLQRDLNNYQWKVPDK